MTAFEERSAKLKEISNKENMQIVIFDKVSEVPEYKYIRNEIPVFATQEYAEYQNRTKTINTIWISGYERGNLIYLIPFCIKNSLFVKKGFFATSVVIVDGIASSSETDFLEHVVEYIRVNLKLDWITQGPNWAIFRSVPSGSINCEFGTYTINLFEKTESELYESIEKKDRYDITKAIKEGCEVVSFLVNLAEVFRDDELLNSIVQLISLDRNELIALADTMQGKLHLYIVKYKSSVQSCALFFFDHKTIYNIYSGKRLEAIRGSNTLLYWTAIKDAKQSGLKIFDFVGARIKPLPGSKQERIQRFKKHFGVELQKGFIWKYPFKRYKYKYYYMLINLYYQLRGRKYNGDIIDQELASK